MKDQLLSAAATQAPASEEGPVSGQLDDQASEESSVMVQPDRQDRQPAARRETPPSYPTGRKARSAARNWFEGSLAQSFVRRLTDLDFAGQAMLFGAGLLVSVLPFVILLSTFANQGIDDDISLRMGLDHRAAGIVNHLFSSAPFPPHRPR